MLPFYINFMETLIEVPNTFSIDTAITGFWSQISFDANTTFLLKESVFYTLFKRIWNYLYLNNIGLASLYTLWFIHFNCC